MSALAGRFPGVMCFSWPACPAATAGARLFAGGHRGDLTASGACERSVDLRRVHCRVGIVQTPFSLRKAACGGEKRIWRPVSGVVGVPFCTFSLGKGSDHGKIGSQSRDRPQW
jgi:hypothetical protein